MKQNTHLLISKKLVGSVVSIGENSAKVSLKITKDMLSDQFGLAHGGFVFGLADYAAMLAVNTPNVVLGKAEIMFLKPTTENEQLIAHAKKIESNGIKHKVSVNVYNNKDIVVFTGTFICFDLEKHVLT